MLHVSCRVVSLCTGRYGLGYAPVGRSTQTCASMVSRNIGVFRVADLTNMKNLKMQPILI